VDTAFHLCLSARANGLIEQLPDDVDDSK